MSHGVSRKLIAALAALLGAAALIAALALATIHSVASTGARAASQGESALIVSDMRYATERSASGARMYLLTGDGASRTRSRQAHDHFQTALDALRERTVSAESRSLLARVAAAHDRYRALVDEVMLSRAGGAPPEDIIPRYVAEVVPAKGEVDGLLRELAALKGGHFHAATEAADRASDRGTAAVAVVGVVAISATAGLALLLWRALRENARQAMALADALRNVEQSNRDLDAFAGRVAHDIRNALTPMLLSVKNLERTASPEVARRSRDRLARATLRAVALVDALLAFSRADGARAPLAASSVREVIESALDQLRPELEEGDVSVVADIADLRVRCAPALLGTIVVNLLTNAAKFAQGRAARRIHVVAQPAEGGCELRVDDNGPGVPSEVRAQIFEPFFRAPGTRAHGTGIGLATVQRIAESHGGRVFVDTSAEGGASFHVVLPLAKDPRGVDLAGRARANPARAPSPRP